MLRATFQDLLLTLVCDAKFLPLSDVQQNAKYTLQGLMYRDFSSPLGQRLAKAKTLRDICTVFDMSAEYEAAVKAWGPGPVLPTRSAPPASEATAAESPAPAAVEEPASKRARVHAS